ncbi:Hypothetical predicted protein [Pelobates cultripes]|uniref:Vitelline membrane outer layer protein 1 homolog n=1 Tax=Pelobates cultripes TaxID=61616 RepID=A0AAD1VV50_PELCU|nr:Hypothetical predicted protein [Pelobates cultripes]
MMVLTLLSFILVLAGQTAGTIIEVPNGAQWGTWGTLDKCAPGTVAKGFTLKQERNQHSQSELMSSTVNFLLSTTDVFQIYSGQASPRFSKSRGPPLPELLVAKSTMKSGGRTGGSPIWNVVRNLLIRVQGMQGLYDDTALNGIRLHCSEFCVQHEEERKVFRSDAGSWGEWKPIRWCLRGFMVAFTLRVEEHKTVGDNTAANNINFMCSKGEYLEGEGMIWGSYGAWSNRCDNGICGIQTKVQENQGLLRDDTALNDVRFLCC